MTSEFEPVRRSGMLDLADVLPPARDVHRAAMVLAAGLAAVVLAMTMLHGYQVSRPVPDATFAFRV